MFCSECGAKATGKFCSHCGFALLGDITPSSLAVRTSDVVVAPTEHLPTDWAQRVDYETIIRVPSVRERIARSAAQSHKRISGEEFLEAFGTITGLPIPMTAVAHAAQALHTKLGIKTGKSRSSTFAAPPGEMLVALFCSLARHGRNLRNVHQLTDGCTLIAALPSDLYALEGDLVITVSRSGPGSSVEARTEIKGQMFDWGKSNRCLAELFAEISGEAAAA
jgi:hypothetical protein